MTLTVDIAPDIFEWARTRSRLDFDFLHSHFPDLDEWETGDKAPTFPELERFAEVTHTPIGFFFSASAPADALPLPDFRTVRDASVRTPSANLLDTISMCEQRQDWYRSFAIENGEDPIPFVESLTTNDPIQQAAAIISETIRFDVSDRSEANSWTDAIRIMSERIEEAGILLMISGVVGSNNRRPLDPDEFRGFVLIDNYAPLIFVNGADAKSAQIFTICHELGHVWLGRSALTDASPAPESSASKSTAADIEVWCNRVAAEILIPQSFLERDYDKSQPLQIEVQRLTRRYKVSSIVVLRRLYDMQRMSRDQFFAAYNAQLEKDRETRKSSGGGNYYSTQAVRTSRKFARAVLRSAAEGRTLYRDAHRLLDIKKESTFEELGRRLGVL